MRRTILPGAVLLGLTLITAAPVAGAMTVDEAIEQVTPGEVSAAVTRFDDFPVTRYQVSGPTPLETETMEGDTTVISLNTDILFAFGSAEPPPSAKDRIAELLEDVPEGMTVQVHGHTDSIGSSEANLALSEERADAVADLISQVRPDLSLQAEGFGESDPVESNEVGGEDNPEGRAANRRVEIRYGG
ncbi:hypothetical protein CFK38_05590 [Brachybacterium vulturis]|uniref:OmpA-like domain-containing protein n=1 Tax=Brachybacterium vulturis TaxID=2017484 RepID=A0A291GLX5_9MICO|nr:OmpA family protein [Brachybacterium vulturis]ATG51062.1 hypothetical protein CFK38_05590 [Brachybacterium vulturis]